MISPRLALAFLFLPGTVIAQHIPVTNWTVPPYRASSASGGYTTMVDISPGVAFTAVQPCRVVDTRGGGVFTGTYGPPIMAANATRAFDINSAPHCTGIPTAVEAYSLNFTVTQTAGAPGDVRAWPTGNPPVQITSVLNWTVANATVANATIMPSGAAGSIDVHVAGTATHLLIDINGYFTDGQNTGQFFEASGSRVGPVMTGQNISTAADAEGVRGTIASTTPGSFSAGVRGINNGTLGNGVGVWGSHAGGGFGVLGTSPGGYGVVGESGSGTGVGGFASGATGVIYGVHGSSSSSSPQSAGVRGVALTAPNPASASPAGVRGESENFIGVLGVSEGIGVLGILMHPTLPNASLADGSLGTAFGFDPDGGGPPWGVHAIGNIGATGIKPFLEPHPTDPTKVIQYIALEGPEAGTYFRGRAKFQRGLARISVPEDFRMVTDPEGLTVQITPMGGMASFGVLRADLQEIVVQGSRDLEFSYLVQGVRASFKDVQPVIHDGTFVPQSADARMPAALAERQKRILIENRVYEEDGTINMETARRLGWDRMWKKRAARPEPQPAPR